MMIKVGWPTFFSCTEGIGLKAALFVHKRQLRKWMIGGLLLVAGLFLIVRSIDTPEGSETLAIPAMSEAGPAEILVNVYERLERKGDLRPLVAEAGLSSVASALDRLPGPGDFLSFWVISQQQEGNSALIKGYGQWALPGREMERVYQTAVLTRASGQWQLSFLEINMAPARAESFWGLLAAGVWQEAGHLLTPPWQKQLSGALSTLNKERQLGADPWLVYFVEGFVEEKAKATVDGELIFRSRANQEQRQKVTLHLFKEGGQWIISEIAGWPFRN